MRISPGGRIKNFFSDFSTRSKLRRLADLSQVDDSAVYNSVILIQINLMNMLWKPRDS